MKKSRLLPLLLPVLLAGCVVSVQPNPTGSGGFNGGQQAQVPGRSPIIQAFDYSPKTGVGKDDAITFTVVATDPGGQPLQYNWTSTRGTLTTNSGQAVSWRPTKMDGSYDPGLAVVSLIVTNGAYTTTGSVNIMIGERGAAEPQAPVIGTPAPTPTPTPTPEATPTPSMTPTPTPSASGTPEVFDTPTPQPSASEGFEPVVVNTRSVQVRLRDDQIEDGDRIKVELNGQVVPGYADYTLLKAGGLLTLDLNVGDNELKVTALNEGRLPPNTTEVLIDADKVVSGSANQLSKGLKTGQSETLKFTVK
jgi:hypothetical protein